MSTDKKISTLFGFKNEVDKLAKFGNRKRDIIDHMSRICSKELIPNEKVLNSLVDTTLNELIGYPWIEKIMRSKILYDIQTTDYFIYDPEFNEKEPTTWDGIIKQFHPKMNLKSRVHMCKFEYNPLDSNVIRPSGTGYYIYNTYDPPDWYSDFYYDNISMEPVHKIPDIYNKFLNHLLNGHEESYSYVLDWLSHAIVDRNRCILVTIGSQGIGKGILGEIMRGLFGDPNFKKVEDDIFKHRFNSLIKDKRIVYIDEFNIKTVEEENKLKTLVNDTIKIEGKGTDAIESKNFSSIYMSSNYFDSLKIAPDDRRFSIVELTNKRITNTWAVSELVELTNPENISKLARFLFFRKYDASKLVNPYKGEYAKQVKAAALFEWQEWFLEDYCIDHAGKSIKLEDVRDSIGEKLGFNRSPSYAKFQKLEEDYPDKFHVVRRNINGKRVWYIDIKPKKEEKNGK